MKNHYVNGLTLIEVLIALAIISIALMSIIKATSHAIKSESYIQDKTIALWIAETVVNETRLNLQKISTSERQEERITMFNHDWYYREELKETANKHIKKISVDVFKEEPDQDSSSIIHLESYLYEA